MGTKIAVRWKIIPPLTTWSLETCLKFPHLGAGFSFDGRHDLSEQRRGGGEGWGRGERLMAKSGFLFGFPFFL
jgi:hypothetical protein